MLPGGGCADTLFPRLAIPCCGVRRIGQPDCPYGHGCGSHCRTAWRQQDHADHLHHRQQSSGGNNDSRCVPLGGDILSGVVYGTVPADFVSRVPVTNLPILGGMDTKGVYAEATSPCGKILRKPYILFMGHLTHHRHWTDAAFGGKQPFLPACTFAACRVGTDCLCLAVRHGKVSGQALSRLHQLRTKLGYKAMSHHKMVLDVL